MSHRAMAASALFATAAVLIFYWRRVSASKVAALTKSPERRTAASAKKCWAAFLSHYKAEAAAEARLLQIELEIQGVKCFLDSDDLRDLRELQQSVRDSAVLILVQSANVLHRPYCLLEIHTAIEAGVPIIGVALAGTPFSYSFDQAAAFLATLDTSLEEVNPGASTILRQANIELADAARILGGTLPSVISISFNACASRRMLQASVGDIIAAMHEARPLPVPPPKEWAAVKEAIGKTAKRSSFSKSTPRRASDVKELRQHGSVTQPDAVLPQSTPTLATIPPEVPALPAALQARPVLLAELKQRLLRPACGTTSLVAAHRSAAATTSAQGMGGVGKTCAAAALLRDAEVGASFERLLWVSVSQVPELLELLHTLHRQLTDQPLPPDVLSVPDAVAATRRAAVGVRVLLCLDDCWDAAHVQMLNICDAQAGSACVITTRLRSLVDGGDEVSCGLLSLDESLNLLLTSAGLAHLLNTPPAAALQAVECCGRLPLALPIAGGMIRELDELWEAELVPMLKEELSEELSIEERVVGASLRCVEKSQRAGVEALFTVCGCFAEDEAVPGGALDVLATLVCERAAVAVPKRPHLKVRKWLAVLLRFSLLGGSAGSGVHAHDLVREVMIRRVEKGEGGMVALQREVVRIFLGAYDDVNQESDAGKAAALKSFIVRSMRHHVSQAHSSGPIYEDTLLMSALGHSISVICARAVMGLGEPRLRSEIQSAEQAGHWIEAAQLWLALSTLRGSRAGHELRRARAAIGEVKPETASSRMLEARVLNLLMFASEGGFAFGSAEHREMVRRAAVLGRADEVSTGAVQSNSSTECFAWDASAADLEAHTKQAMLSNTLLHDLMVRIGLTRGDAITVTAEGLASAHTGLEEATELMSRAASVAPSAAAHHMSSTHVVMVGVALSCFHRLEAFDKDRFFGRGGARLRMHLQTYDFGTMHGQFKTGNTFGRTDNFLYGTEQLGMLLWYGDVEAARTGWLKVLDAWRQIALLLERGERSVGEYSHEGFLFLGGLASGMLAAGEVGVLRELLELMPAGLAMRDARVAAEWETAVRGSPMCWEDPSTGRGFGMFETYKLQLRALNSVVATEGDCDEAQLRTWLPRPEELVALAHKDLKYSRLICGAAHPSLLCATLYADHLGGWDAAEAIAEGLVSMLPVSMCPLTRIEAWRLLARCRGSQGDTAAACAALESAVEEARVVGYVWMVQKVREDMHMASKAIKEK